MAGIIAIVVVMFVINAFMIYTVYGTWKKTNSKVEKYFLNNTSGFGPVREQIEVESNEVKSEEGLKIVEKHVYVTENTDVASYKKENFKDDYKNVKETMDFAKNSVVSNIIEEAKESKESDSSFKLLEVINFDVVYELNTLKAEEQVEILRSSLTGENLETFENYLKSIDQKFDIVSFYDYIKQLTFSEDSNIYVKTGWKNDKFDDLGDNVVTVYDDKITEGVKVVHKNKLYDYSI